ncbi:heavy-metal-associated domain-containing protein [Mesorhizobium sp. B2-6-2]|uniref:heavy-metal-associated domain-containing protein n=1 Tax=Mesorhizobium sp. B2-6-2 TaxID=2589915 RepID=UPI001126B582|nr:heavy-metal-associated domain-containing protein [Mesorhizobium sp. B2-6-2]TPJ77150.1 heavy-metal-associated domain-containing protein [Mesorhizobium sp. B2-6-2]
MCEEHDHHPSVAASSASVSATGTTLYVSDMTCSHCAGVITSALEQTLPNAKFSIDLSKARVTVDGDAALAMEAIRTAGYSPERIAI